MTTHLAILAVGLWLSCPSQLWGQGVPDSLLWRAIDSLTHGTFIRVKAADSEFVGQFAGRTAYDIILERHDRSLAVPALGVVRLWEANGRGTKDGFWVGAIIGGVAGATLGLLFGGLMCESGCEAQTASAVVMAGLGGAATIGVVGAAIGSLGFAWKQRFP